MVTETNVNSTHHSNLSARSLASFFIALLFVYCVQVLVLPGVFHGLFEHIDLVTPLIVFAVAYARLSSIIVLAMAAALLLETSSSLPVGFYFCVYGILVSLVYLSRGSMSWSSFRTWFLVNFVAQILVIVLKLICFYIKPLHQLDFFSVLVDFVLGASVAAFFVSFCAAQFVDTLRGRLLRVRHELC